MSNFGQTEDFDNRQQEQDEKEWLEEMQEVAEHNYWLDEREKEMVDNLEFNLKQMWKQFERDFKQVLNDQEPETKHNQGE